jgi:hypothetical protein
MGGRGYVPAMAAMPHLSTALVGRVLVAVRSHRVPSAPNCIGAHSPGAVAFGAPGTKGRTGFQPVFWKDVKGFQPPGVRGLCFSLRLRAPAVKTGQ